MATALLNGCLRGIRVVDLSHDLPRRNRHKRAIHGQREFTAKAGAEAFTHRGKFLGRDHFQLVDDLRAAGHNERRGQRGLGRDVIERAHRRGAGKPRRDAGARAIESDGDARFHAALHLSFVEDHRLGIRYGHRSLRTAIQIDAHQEAGAMMVDLVDAGVERRGLDSAIGRIERGRKLVNAGGRSEFHQAVALFHGGGQTALLQEFGKAGALDFAREKPDRRSAEARR